MEVVLLEDVKALGKKGQIVKVSDGYGRNFILTKKLVLPEPIKTFGTHEVPIKLHKEVTGKLAVKVVEA